jgi:hypothetical protein
MDFHDAMNHDAPVCILHTLLDLEESLGFLYHLQKGRTIPRILSATLLSMISQPPTLSYIFLLCILFNRSHVGGKLAWEALGGNYRHVEHV